MGVQDGMTPSAKAAMSSPESRRERLPTMAESRVTTANRYPAFVRKSIAIARRGPVAPSAEPSAAEAIALVPRQLGAEVLPAKPFDGWFASYEGDCFRHSRWL
jgi:hypothetical protein